MFGRTLVLLRGSPRQEGTAPPGEQGGNGRRDAEVFHRGEGVGGAAEVGFLQGLCAWGELLDQRFKVLLKDCALSGWVD